MYINNTLKLAEAHLDEVEVGGYVSYDLIFLQVNISVKLYSYLVFGLYCGKVAKGLIKML